MQAYSKEILENSLKIHSQLEKNSFKLTYNKRSKEDRTRRAMKGN